MEASEQANEETNQVIVIRKYIDTFGFSALSVVVFPADGRQDEQ